MRNEPAAELVVLSHLRWTFVWQRPQHIISRLARARRTWFVEEPVAAAVASPRLRWEDHGPVTRVWLEVPGTEAHVGFGDRRAACYGELLAGLVGASSNRICWLYTPMALPLLEALRPAVVAYDVMDDLASFDGAPEELLLRQRQALRSAHIVFTGGRSIHRGIVRHRRDGTHLFPSGVEPEHFQAATGLRRPNPRPVAGYVGVIDERIDRPLLGQLAERLPDWDIRVVGPVAKIDPESLPSAPNLEYPGPAPYEKLPEVLAGFDVALMPFALNRATRSISPTKTLEYLAAGLPVVSTPVPDVVADHAGWVDVVDGAEAFADACRRVLAEPASSRQETVERVLRTRHWDAIAAQMDGLLAGASAEALRRRVLA